MEFYIVHGTLYSPWNPPGQNTGVGSLSLLQEIFPTQGLNPGLLHCRQIFYQLSHKGSPRILEWVAYSFSRGSSQSRNQTKVSCIAGRFFTNWAITEAPDKREGVYVYASLVAQTVKNLPAMQKTWVQSLGWEDPLEEEMATHSNIPPWRIPWTEEPGEVQSIVSHRVRHNWSDLACTETWCVFYENVLVTLREVS